jgi:hypothetical protein
MGIVASSTSPTWTTFAGLVMNIPRLASSSTWTMAIAERGRHAIIRHGR